MPEIAALRAGDPGRLGPYRLTGLIGEGGQGAVYLAEDEPGHRVAVKLLHARFSGDPKARSRFAAEVAVAQRVSPFCTARILDSDVEGDRPYIVSEYIGGPALSAVLSTQGPRHGADLDRIAIGTMTALAAIHQAGIVHRDFKPANVLLAPDGPRVIDFGVARALDATGTLSSTAVGTPAYMAPEQISGAVVGPAADVWAWGATMVYAATMRLAFGQDSIPAVMHRILNLAPDLGTLAEPLRGLVANCLSKDPALRPASEQVLAYLLNVAGSLPSSGAVEDTRATEILSQGAEAAAAASGGLRSLQAPAGPASAHSASAFQPPYQRSPAPQSPTPPPPAYRPPPEQPPGVPVPGAQMPGGMPPVAPPALPWDDPYATAPAGGPPGGRGKRGIGVLAGAGSAAVVALILVGTVIAIRLSRDDDRKEPVSPGRVGGELTMAALTGNNVDGEIDPSHSFSGTNKFLAKQLFTGLTEIGPDGVARNRLATGIKPDLTCENWTISIKQGTTFGNGETVDAQAFARGWNRSAATVDGAASVLMTDIKGYTDVSTGKATEMSGLQVSGTGLTVALTSPNCDFAARLADPVFAPVPEDAGKSGNEEFNLHPIGNGPFTLQSYAKDKSATLVRNDKWAFGKTKLDKVIVQMTSDSAQGRAGVASGSIGWAFLGTKDYSAVRGQSGVTTRPTPFTRMLVPITTRGPMSSKNARLAVSYAIDRGRISSLWGGVYQPAHAIVPMAIPGFGGPGSCPSCDSYDPEKAKTLAEQAGLGQGTTVRLYYQDNEVNRTNAQLIAGQLRSTLGWKIEMKTSGATDFTAFRKGLVAGDASGLAIFGWGPDYPGAYTMLWPLLGGTVVATESNGYTNFSGWKNTGFDATMSRALGNSSAETRNGLFGQAEKIALADMALIPLVNTGAAALTSGKYTGLGLDYDGDPTLATAALK